jgi:hypothetical protein
VFERLGAQPLLVLLAKAMNASVSPLGRRQGKPVAQDVEASASRAE